MKNRYISTFIVGICLMAGFSYGTDLLDMPSSVRGVGMGDAVIGLDKNASGFFFNPASATGLSGLSFSVLYNRAVFDDTFCNATVVQALGAGHIGLQFGLLSVPLPEVYEFGSDVGAETLNNISLGLGYQRDLSKDLSLGVNVKAARTDLLKDSGWTPCADLGVLFRSEMQGREPMHLGVAVRNIGLGSKVGMLPTSASFGTSFAFHPAVHLSLDVDYLLYYRSIGLGGGLEFTPGHFFMKSEPDILAVRCGYKKVGQNGTITAGLGINKKLNGNSIIFDYGINVQSEIGLSHYVSVGMSLEKTGK